MGLQQSKAHGIPLDLQPPTIARPWGGEFINKDIQSPPFYATVALPDGVWHRSDARLGSHRAFLSTNMRPQ